MEAIARFRFGISGTGWDKACEPGKTCDLALSLEAATGEAWRGSIHIFATKTRDECWSWR